MKIMCVCNSLHGTKILSLAAVALIMITLSLSAENVTLTATGPIGGTGQSTTLAIETNETATVVFMGGYGGSVETLVIQKGGKTYNHSHKNQPWPTVVGPATLTLNVNSAWVSTSSFCTIQVARQSDLFIPSNSVVIPADSSGPVTIVLESSTDLISWTSAMPGTYGTATTNRFFRVRAQR